MIGLSKKQTETLAERFIRYWKSVSDDLIQMRDIINENMKNLSETNNHNLTEIVKEIEKINSKLDKVVIYVEGMEREKEITRELSHSEIRQ